LTVRGYLHALQRYRQVLARRNALLRQGAPAAVVAAWDEGLTSWGSRVIGARARWVAERDPSFGRHVSRIASGGAAGLEYEGAGGGRGREPGEVAGELARELDRGRERGERRGRALVGRRRGDRRIRGPGEAGGVGVDLRVYGSGGQQRTAAVALRMVEAESLT